VIRILVVEDSATVRRFLTALFTDSGQFLVVGASENGDDIATDIQRLRPDVVSLDVYMPGPSAAEIVRRVRQISAVPIILLSDAPRNAKEVFDALDAGAIDVQRKPKAKDPQAGRHLLNVICAICAEQRTPNLNVPAVGVVVIGSSAGGPRPLRTILGALPGSFPVPIVVAQHMAKGFEPGLATWLGEATGCRVRVARVVEPLEKGVVLLGPSGTDVVIRSRQRVEVRQAPLRGYHPSADTLFTSAASHFGSSTVAIVLSGVGEDGSKGAAAVSAAGGQVLTQDRASAGVFGMPGSAKPYATLVGSPDTLGLSLLNFVRPR
jgi:two-component system, chemotaxis family, protein-glutamate methylesterase/glutaminase